MRIHPPLRSGPLLLALLLSALCSAALWAQEGDTIGPRDVLKLTVAEAPQLNTELEVRADGTVDIPNVGSIRIGGLPLGEAEQRLRQLFESRVLQRGMATVTLEIKEYRSRTVHLLGAFGRTGEMEIQPGARLLQVVLAAGGVQNERGRIRVVRAADNGLSAQLEIPVRALLVEADPRVNLPLVAGDIISVPQATSITVYLQGEVASPGPVTFETDEPPTLATAIIKAGGLTTRASKRAVIRRRRPDNTFETIKVSHHDILNGRSEDYTLVEGDLVRIPMSFL